MKAIGPRLVIATHNSGKLREIRELLAPFGIDCVGAAELDLPEPEETGVTFVDNAELKARAAADLTGLPALSDDSGLSVDALHGKPGIHSARWAENESGERDFGRAMERVWQEVGAAGPDAGHDAHFTCVLSLAWPDGTAESFEGKAHGTLVWPPRGANGFGYDAMFLPVGGGQTFGEMEPAAKHAISHRAEAFRKLVAALG
ncbi:RdgB/HAM1 family non-canonical purine NTP pyrophosphatase [Sphingomonas sp. BN140010]|uniref:dITP/XTP pyrophosphatase n=1 Tax=Sphingomonas arvum TaxID=2992113 RepID=A0ABT3JI52_9SPHN|nr:RdgB/HAM1 family non-canonical purine NTP pyrophosphatase [Sphingomonas sp. BN140010]MCW3798661.1 RdgB/HAM1 family non-canonical purine NTP pyrophosphatase [Sphingomonas sp. BN140010]